MRIIVFFDLPVTTAAKRKATSSDFSCKKTAIKCCNYPCIPASCVAGIRCKNTTHDCETTCRKGSIRCLEVTEKQFATMHLLLGELKTQEKKVNADQLLLF